MVVDGGTVAWVGRAADAPDADQLIDAGGRAVIPGFVDSHAHLVFAGDRSQEFAARMAGEAVRRRRHPHHGRRDPRRHRRAADQPRRAAGPGDASPGHHHRRDQERLRADRPRRGAQPGDRPSVHRGDDLPRRARRTRSAIPRLRRAGHRPHAGRGRAVRAVDRRVLRDGRVRRGPGPQHPGGRVAARTPGASARQPAGPGPGSPAGGRARPGRGRPLHPPHRRGRPRTPRLRHDRDPAAGRGVLDPRSRTPTRAASSTPGSGSRSRATATPARASPARCRCASPSRSARWG